MEFKVLSWNLWVTGPSEYGKAAVNETAYFSYLAEVIHLSGANVVALQEVTFSALDQISFTMVDTLNGYTDGADWRCAIVKAAPGVAYQTEGYLYVWDENQVRAYLDIDGSPLCGLAGNYFPGNYPPQAGRKACYMLFEGDGGEWVMVVNYHAPSNILGAEAGLTSIREMFQNAISPASLKNPVVFSPALPVNPSAFLSCGDYNVNICTDQVQYQQRLMAPQPPLYYSCTSATSLINNTAINQMAVSLVPFLSSGYDNILYSRGYRANTVQVVNAIGSTIGGQPLSPFLDGYFFQNGLPSQPTFTNGNLTQNPPADYYQSYIFYRYAISDHLPVYAEFDM